MRQHLARAAVAVSIAVVLALSFFAARARHGGAEFLAGDRGAAAPADEPAAQVPSRGRAVYNEQGCAGCHSIAGAGNPRYPLDGVGSRRSADDMRAWIVGAETLADSLPPSAFRRKQQYRRLPAADMAALVAYLVGLKAGP